MFKVDDNYSITKTRLGCMLRWLAFFVVALFATLPTAAQQARQWADSIYLTLSPAERVAQMLVLPVSTHAPGWINTRQQIQSLKPGAILVTQGGPRSHAKKINELQRSSRVPLLVGMGAAWGPGQTLDSALTFGKPLQLGALPSDSLVGLAGRQTGRHLKRLGIHLALGPQAGFDLEQLDYPGLQNFFSTQKERTASRASAWMSGLQSEGVIACATHDAHSYPSLEDNSAVLDLNRLDTGIFFAYRQLIARGLGAIHTANLHFSIQGKNKPVPAAASQLFVGDLLKQRMNFSGLMIADMPFLSTVTGQARAGKAEALALEAGYDLLVNPNQPARAVRQLTRMIRRNKNLQARLEEAVKKILIAKFNAGLKAGSVIDETNLPRDINTGPDRWLREEIFKQAITVINPGSESVPIAVLEEKKFLHVAAGSGDKTNFHRALNDFVQVDPFFIQALRDTTSLARQASPHDVVIIGLFPGGEAISSNLIAYAHDWMAAGKQVIMINFTDPSVTANCRAVTLLTYSDDPVSIQGATEIVFGARPARGRLPFDLSQDALTGSGEQIEPVGRIAHAEPEAAGMDSETLNAIDVIAAEAIARGATPGCRVLAVRNGKVVVDRSYGYLTYDQKIAVSSETIYDLASVTKISATLQTTLFLEERGLIDLHKKASVYLPELKSTNKKDYTLKDILTHQAGLWPFLPFWVQTMKDSAYLAEFYQTAPSADFPFPVANNLYASKGMKDSLWVWIQKARVREKPVRTPHDYRYSDMGFYILQHVAETLLNQPMEDFLAQNLYEPLGASTLGYLPLDRFPPSRIAPTEDDKLFRKSLLTGYVHDQGAAMHGGVAGHAGLFGTAVDLAKLGQLWLKRGSYGGQLYFKPETIDRFASRQFDNSRRGLGWDKSTPGDYAGPTSLYASPRTFGHTGFTGTCIWVDPEFDLVYVFLSNRVHPDMNNNRLLNANIRPRIQDVLYQSIFEYCAENRRKN